MAKVTTRNRNKNQVYKDGRKKPANWEYRFEKAPINGVRQHASKSGFRTQKEAYDAGLKALNEYNNGGGLIHPSEMSFSDYLDQWMEKHIAVNMKPKTYMAYETYLKVHIRPALGHYRLSALQPSILQDFANDLKKKGMSKNYTYNIISVLKSSLDYAVAPMQYIKYNYAAHIILPNMETRDRSKRVVFNQEQWQKIIQRFPFGHKYHMPLMLGYHTGMRISEALSMTWDAIDLENGLITVDKQLLRYRPEGQKVRWCLCTPKSKAGNRTIKIGDTLLNTLKRERRRQMKNKLMYGEFYKQYTTVPFGDLLEIHESEENTIDFVCLQDDGTHMKNTLFQHCPRIIRKELGIEFDFHTLRHTHATMLAENGVNPKNLQARLGHQLVQTTLQTYIHDTENMADQTVDIFEKIIGGQK